MRSDSVAPKRTRSSPTRAQRRDTPKKSSIFQIITKFDINLYLR
ncbi:MAG: hypothetical protein NZ455_07555 [Bacteroidia bacterium]|nr:hypothetical protein [Bacteroidia bacterium]